MMRDDFDDFFDRLKKYFKLDTDMFDVDFLFIPESNINFDKSPNDEKVKSFKISYHFESGMDKPEIKFEGNMDDKNIREYLKNVDVSKIPKLNKIYKSQSKKEIDANSLSLETFPKQFEEGGKNFVEPYTEICDNEGFSEILIEIPGMGEDNVNFAFEDKGKKIIFMAENEKHKYRKVIPLLFSSSEKECKLEVNNGIAILKILKKVK
ncbi:MAG: hypothetical protein ACFFA0_11305 [Promethearchaeota archaeon]